MSDKKVNLHVGDIIQPDETWRIEDRSESLFPSLSKVFQMSKDSEDNYYANCKRFTDEFGDNARLIITAIHHKDSTVVSHGERSPKRDILALQVLNENGEYDLLAPVFEANANSEFTYYTPDLTDINIVDHYQPTFYSGA